MAPRLPTPRGFTKAEARALSREKWTGKIVVAVALMAMAISFVALYYVGDKLGLPGWTPALLPLAVDGFAVACALGIARATDTREGLRGSWSEWVGMCGALGISVTGNVWHGLAVGDPTLPQGLVVAFAAVPPVITAWGVHVWSKQAMKGISAHVLVDAPDELQFGLAQLGEPTPAPKATRAPEPRRASPTPAPAPATVAAAASPRAQVSAPVPPPIQRAHEAHVRAQATAARAQQDDDARAQDVPAARIAETPASRKDARDAQPVVLPADNGKALIEAEVRASHAEDPNTKPDASALHKQFRLTCNPATSRRWVQAEWDRLTAEAARTAGPQRGGSVIDLAGHQAAAGARS